MWHFEAGRHGSENSKWVILDTISAEMPALKNVPLPGQGDRLFKCRRIAAPIRPAFGVWPAWARAYKASADLLVDSDLRGEEAAAQIYTVVYLYRHFLELELKSVVVLSFLAANVDDAQERVRQIFRTHSLMDLPRDVRRGSRFRSGTA
jgi:hypothetical protein